MALALEHPTPDLAAPQDAGIPQAAAALAYAGALPLILAAAALWAAPERFLAPATAFATAHGTLLMIFFGGIRWGVAVMRRSGATFRALGGAIAPAALAFPLLFVDAPRGELALFVAAFPLLLWDDLRTTKKGDGAPQWYLGVRAPLTVLMELALIAILAGVFALG